jgi:long-chain acyl-CoA synthetase
VKKSIFMNALKVKEFATSYNIPGLAGLTDRVVFNQVKAQTGGKLRIALSGGGAVSAATQEFLTNAVVKVIQGEVWCGVVWMGVGCVHRDDRADVLHSRTGYGLTETVGMCTILHPDFFNYGVCGCPVPSMEIKVGMRILWPRVPPAGLTKPRLVSSRT